MNSRPGTVAAYSCLALFVSTLAFGGEAQKKLPIPDTGAQAEAAKLVKEVYGEEYAAARTSTKKQAFAKKMLAKAMENNTEAASRFVLLRLSRDVAMQSDEVETAFQTIDEMNRTFQVDAAAMQIATLAKFSATVHAAEQHKALSEEAMALFDQALAKDDFPFARQFVGVASLEAKKAKDKDLIQAATIRSAEIEEQSHAYDSAKAAMVVLQQTPNDPDANLTVGKYKCFVKDDWEAGIPLLALASDPPVKILATKELVGVASSDEQAKLGDGWWNLAETRTGQEQIKLRGRADYWYQKAMPGLTGLIKDKVEKRLMAASSKEPSGTDARGQPKGVIADTVALWNTHNGYAFDRGALVCNLLLRSGGKTIWHRDKIEVPWNQSLDPQIIVKIPHIRFDALRVGITQAVNGNGGLSEIEVYSAGKNIAKGLPATASATFKNDPRFVPSKVTDGISQSTRLGVGYWILPDKTPGWIEVDFTGLDTKK